MEEAEVVEVGKEQDEAVKTPSHEGGFRFFRRRIIRTYL